MKKNSSIKSRKRVARLPEGRRVERPMNEWDIAERDHIRRHLALPEIERMNFLVIRLPGGGFAL